MVRAVVERHLQEGEGESCEAVDKVVRASERASERACVGGWVRRRNQRWRWWGWRWRVWVWKEELEVEVEVEVGGSHLHAEDEQRLEEASDLVRVRDG
eukprot:scaffold118379_cov38-Phaeocystis_antarctica.AAC.3